MTPELTMTTVATFRCLIQESHKHVITRLELSEDSGMHKAEIRSQFNVLNDPVGKTIHLSAEGRSASEAMGNLEKLLQEWY
jgi:phosphotransferase system HPr-like phosphotransfer protein